MGVPKGNQYFNGNKGEVWINGIPAITCYKGEIIKKNKYEDIPAPTGDGTIRVFTGHTIEVSLAYRRTGVEDFEAFRTSEDVSLIIAETNIDGKITRRIKADGITFNDETLSKFEKNKVGEIELSGQAETYEVLQEK
ncbi:MAG: phage tail tube protein [Fusobacteriaceae bacterium]